MKNGLHKELSTSTF